ncbi:MAG TPA: hypothetical protein VKV15_07125 [Bryobacteraceae bacterium]|nr:hypothetical protein [Bryobacteraceae bacterium]
MPNLQQTISAMVQSGILKGMFEALQLIEMVIEAHQNLIGDNTCDSDKRHAELKNTVSR